MSNMKYEDNDREFTLAEIEEILTDKYGKSEYDRESGCYSNGEWFSVNAVLETLDESL